MRFPALTVLTLVLSALCIPAHGAEHTVEARPSNSFFPRDLNITVGDTVTWINVGGRHNVAATDGSFRCANGCDGQGGDGSPANNDWSFSLTFNTQGTIDYLCEPHAGLGMTGSIIVGPATPPEPGELRLTSAGQQAAESAGFVVQVQRSGGSDGAVSVQYSTADGSAQAGSDYQAASGMLDWADGDQANKSFSVIVIDDSLDEASETLSVMLSNPTGGASLGSPSTATLTISDNDDPTGQAGTLAFTATELQRSEAAESVSISVQRTGGSTGAVGVSYTTQDGSARAGEDYSTTVGTLSWADGESGIKTFEVPLLDDLEIEGAETVNLLLSNPTGGASLGSSSATLTLLDDEQGTCMPDLETLCLGDGRFQVKVAWENFEGLPGTAKAVDIGRRDSGLFYFFSESNIEMLVKVLDGCAINERFWISYAATTNVGFELMVVDIQTGESKRYENPVGMTAETVLDTDAMAVCP